jgi:hypothetical protein
MDLCDFIVNRKNESGHLAFDPLAELDNGECHLRTAPTFPQMGRTQLKPGLRPGFGWRWHAQQLFNAPFGVVHVLKRIKLRAARSVQPNCSSNHGSHRP